MFFPFWYIWSQNPKLHFFKYIFASSFVFSSIYPGWLACIEQIQTIFKKSINVSPIDATLNVIVFAKMILQLH